MTSKTRGFDEHQPGQISSLWVLAARLTWIVLGPFALALVSAGIVLRGTGWATTLDAGFGAVVGLMLLARWAEQRSGCAMTTHGQAATPAQCRQYMVGLTLVASALWVGANLLGNHVLR